MQLENFKKVEKSLRQKLGSSETTKILSRAVYLFSIGGNDYHDVETIRPYKEEYIAMVIGNITMALKVRLSSFNQQYCSYSHVLNIMFIH